MKHPEQLAPEMIQPASASVYSVPPEGYYPNTQAIYNFHNCPARFKWLCGGIGGGKTYAGVIEAGMQAFIHNPGKRGMIVVPDYNTFMDVDWPLIQELWPKLYTATRVGHHIHKININCGNGKHSEILIRSAMNKQTVQRIDGPTISWFWMDEPSRMLVGHSAWRKAIGRLREAGGRPQGFLTGSPRGINWIAKAFEQENRLPKHAWNAGCEPRENYWIFASRTKDNPHNSDYYYESLVDAYSQEFAEQELEGDIIAAEGRIYPNFFRDVHVVQHDVILRLLKRSKRLVGGADFGWTNEAALCIGGFDRDDNYSVVEEWYKRRKTTEQMGMEAATMEFRYLPYVYGTGAMVGGRHADWHCEHEPENIHKWKNGFSHDGLKYQLPGARKAIKDWQAGVDAVRNLLTVKGIGVLDHPGKPPGNRFGRPGLLISDRCVNLAREFMSYRELEVEEDKPPSEGATGPDHLLDALRYAVLGYIRQFKEGPQRARGV